MSDATETFSPIQVERAIHRLANTIAEGVEIYARALQRFLDADLAYDVAFAHAQFDFKGPAYAKKYAAVLATVEQRKARDVADVAFRHADKMLKARELELRAWQSVGASVRQAYAVAGRGEF